MRNFAMLTPMKYYNNETDCPKRQDMINNKDDLYMATVKHDGDWAMLIHYGDGNNLIRSRSISKVTNVYGDYTAKVPHIAQIMNLLPPDTVLLAELCWDEPGTNANTVGTILRCLPAKAVERQKEKKLKAVVFDALCIAGEDIMDQSYEYRFHRACKLIQDVIFPCLFMYPTQECKIDEHHENFLEWADEIIADGGEGLVIQLKSNPYMPDTRSAWKTLKLKQSLPEKEFRVVATIQPKIFYDGDNEDTWEYWYQDMPNANSQMGNFPVTKPYFYGWKNGVTIKIDDDITCDVTSGLTDADREWLATDEAQIIINNGGLYAVVKAMSFNEKGRLRHPYLVRLRTDVVKE